MDWIGCQEVKSLGSHPFFCDMYSIKRCSTSLASLVDSSAVDPDASKWALLQGDRVDEWVGGGWLAGGVGEGAWRERDKKKARERVAMSSQTGEMRRRDCAAYRLTT